MYNIFKYEVHKPKYMHALSSIHVHFLQQGIIRNKQTYFDSRMVINKEWVTYRHLTTKWKWNSKTSTEVFSRLGKRPSFGGLTPIWWLNPCTIYPFYLLNERHFCLFGIKFFWRKSTQVYQQSKYSVIIKHSFNKFYVLIFALGCFKKKVEIKCIAKVAYYQCISVFNF